MLEDREWIVPMTLVRHADGVPRHECAGPGAVSQPERVAALRDRVRDGYYATASMMELVARRILASGDV
jgi:hypothetical protein